MILWNCIRCGKEQGAPRHVPVDRICCACEDAQRPPSFTEVDAGIPERYRNLTREGWEAHFQRPWPAALERWTGAPPWVALWGSTGTGKTGLATILLAEHLRTGRRGRWIFGPELARRLRIDFRDAEDLLAPPGDPPPRPAPEGALMAKQASGRRPAFSKRSATVRRRNR